jgi:hypothetical protein
MNVRGGPNILTHDRLSRDQPCQARWWPRHHGQQAHGAGDGASHRRNSDDRPGFEHGTVEPDTPAVNAFLASVLVLPSLLVLWTRYLGPSGHFPESDTPDEVTAADGGGETTSDGEGRP